jgi:hypothetical protein
MLKCRRNGKKYTGKIATITTLGVDDDVKYLKSRIGEE